MWDSAWRQKETKENFINLTGLGEMFLLFCILIIIISLKKSAYDITQETFSKYLWERGEGGSKFKELESSSGWVNSFRKDWNTKKHTEHIHKKKYLQNIPQLNFVFKLSQLIHFISWLSIRKRIFDTVLLIECIRNTSDTCRQMGRSAKESYREKETEEVRRVVLELPICHTNTFLRYYSIRLAILIFINFKYYY